MPNHYTNIITACTRWNSDDEYLLTPETAKAWADGVLQRLIPMPDEYVHPNPRYLTDSAVDWRRSHWGTKWDVYEVTACVLAGDSFGVVIQFVTAWSPPNADARRVLLDDLGRLAQQAIWVGVDPYDYSIRVLERRRAD